MGVDYAAFPIRVHSAKRLSTAKREQSLNYKIIMDRTDCGRNVLSEWGNRVINGAHALPLKFLVEARRISVIIRNDILRRCEMVSYITLGKSRVM